MNRIKQQIKAASLLAAMTLTGTLTGTFNGIVYGQNEALDVTRSIADKIIRETSFEYELVPMSYNAGISRFSLEKGEAPEEVSYGWSRMKADKEIAGFMGLSWSGRIAVFLNGEKIFEGTSAKVDMQEYTYNRYRFTEKIPVTWLKGENQLLIKCATGQSASTVVILPVNDIDEKLPEVNALSANPGTPNTHWLTCGPWDSAVAHSAAAHSAAANSAAAHSAADPISETTASAPYPVLQGVGMETVFPPEEGFRDYYSYDEQVIAWQLEEVPLLRKLVVSDSNSYTRDPYADWHYANGGTMLAILSLYETSGDENYLDFVQRFADNIVENEDYFRWQYFTLQAVRGSYHRIYRMTMLDDTGGPALPFAELKRMKPESEKFGDLLERNLNYVLNQQERLEDLTLSRPEPEPATVWADDLFMAVPFLLRIAEISGDETLYDEVARQVIQFNRYLCDQSTGLYLHGWYDGRGKNTPVHWGRANGWIVWATSEALLHMPKKHPEYKAILRILRKHMKAIASVQDASGMWHQVLDHPETWEESSCTAMFTLAMARGARMGWLKKEYGEKALKAWAALQSKIREDGTVVDICRGTGIGEDVEFYATRKRFDHDPRGLGAMITAGCEISLLEQD